MCVQLLNLHCPRNGAKSGYIDSNSARLQGMTAARRNNEEHGIEVVGKKLRAMMPWIASNKIVDQDKN